MIAPVLTLMTLIFGIPAFALLALTLAAIVDKFSRRPLANEPIAKLNTLSSVRLNPEQIQLVSGI